MSPDPRAETPTQNVVTAWRGGPPSPVSLQEQIRQGYRQQGGRALPVILVVGVAVNTAQLTLRHPDQAGQQSQPRWLLAVAVLFFSLVFVLAGVRLWQRRRSGTTPWQWSPVWALTVAERKVAVRQVRGRLPVRPQQVPLLRLLARQQVDLAAAAAALLSLAASLACLTVLHRHTGDASYLGALAVLLMAVGGHTSWQVAHGRGFLRQHPARS